VVNIPYSNKELQVNYSSYRNKTEPGTKETYTVTIKGNDGNKAAAELLTAMYDASLDQFKKQSWNVPPYIWKINYYKDEFNNGNNFTTNYSINNYKFINQQPGKTIYDRLLSPDVLKDDISRGMELAKSTGFNQDQMLTGKVAGVNISNDNVNDVVVIGYGTRKKK